MSAPKTELDVLTVPECRDLAWRDLIETDETAGYLDRADTFLAVEDPTPEFIIPELIQRKVIGCFHGDPRTMKSLSLRELAVAAVTGTPAFGLERFQPKRQYRVLYSSQEDGAAPVRIYFKALLRGRGISTFPSNLFFSVHKGIDLENLDWQNRLIRHADLLGFDLIVFDPIRRFAPSSDKGPADVARITAFLRRLVNETGATVDISHHDTKPPSNGKDMRRRSQKASGGDWFAASESPVAFERLNEDRVLIVPEDYKFSSDPKPFTIRYTDEKEADGVTPKIIRLIGEDSTAEEAQSLAIDDKILAYLTDNPGKSGSAIATSMRTRKDDVLAALDRLFKCDKIDSVQKGKAKLWTLRKAAI